MRYVIGALFAFALALVQASSIEQFHILGVAPNLVLVLLVSWLVVRGLDDVLPMVACAGITLGFVGLQTPGLVLLALLLPLVALGALRELHVVQNNIVMALAFVAAASLVYETVMLAGVMATGGVFEPLTALTSVIVPAAIVNLAIAPPVYVAMRFAKPSPRRGWLAY